MHNLISKNYKLNISFECKHILCETQLILMEQVSNVIVNIDAHSRESFYMRPFQLLSNGILIVLKKKKNGFIIFDKLINKFNNIITFRLYLFSFLNKL